VLADSHANMSLARITIAELGAKIDGFGLELAHWRQRGEDGEILERHHSQLRSVTQVLGSAAAALDERLAAVDLRAGVEVVWSGIGSVRRAIDTLADIWVVFLNAFGMRSVDNVAPYLYVADELAWACYAPVHRWVEPGMTREPPLVTPAEQRPSPFREQALERLPVPLVSLPWLDIKHLPSLPLIASQVGHVVALDLDLHAALRERLDADLPTAGVPPDRTAQWLSWLAETFSMAYGVLALGPAFASTAVTTLAAHGSGSARPSRPGPDVRLPSAARVGVVLETLALTGFEDEAAALGAAWRDAFPDREADEFESDLPAVISSIVASPLPQFEARTVRDVIAFSPRDHEAAAASAAAVLRALQPPAADVRSLVCSARLAFDEDPDRYVHVSAGERIQRRIMDVATTGVQIAEAGRFVHDEPKQPASEAVLSALQRASSAAAPVERPAPPQAAADTNLPLAPISPPALTQEQEQTRTKRFSAALVARINAPRASGGA
jgi:hypothetical protein